ncbi:hypothetical protein GCM10009557_25850 [Virgisporangium ochraceum]
MSTRRTPWLVAAVGVGLAGFAGLAGVTVFVAGQGMDGSGDWAGVLSLMLAGLLALCSLVVWLVRLARRVDDGGPPVADRLRKAVRVQWTAEAAARRLTQPRPLRLTWHPTARPVSVAAPGTGTRSLRGSLADRDALASARGLVDAFRTNGQRQLVVLGAPGAGKTTFALLFTIAAAEAADGPVPVLLTVAGWNPAEPIETWVAGRIAADYPAVAGFGPAAVATVRQLIDGRLVLPVLDGLDEMPLPLLGPALESLDRAAGSGLPMVVTCRHEEFEQAVGQAGALSNAAVVEIDPVRAADAEAFLTDREVSGSTRWQPVLDELRRNPTGPIATVLSTPLMIALARRVYQRPGTDPSQLCAFRTVAELERHLLDRLLETAYPGPDAGRRERRWLAYLARHLLDTARDPDLLWWRLARAVPDGVLIGIVAAALTVVGSLTGLAVDGSAPNAAFGAAIGLSVGVLCGRHTVRVTRATGQVTGRRWIWATARNSIVDVTVAVTTVAALFSVLVTAFLAVRGLLDPPGAVAANTLLVIVGTDLVIQPGYAVTFAVIGSIFAAVLAGLGAGRGGEPRRSSLRPGRLLPSLGFGLTLGLLVGLLTIPLGGPYLPLAFMLVIGIPVGLGRWLTGTPAADVVTSPLSMLRSDRTALLATVTVVVAGTAVTAHFIYAAPLGLHPVVTLTIAAVFGLLAAFGTGAAWLSYTMARLWLAARGHLPWRPMRFLRRAHAAGVLRQAGPSYQFRHDLLRVHLAPPEPPPPDRTDPRARRWWPMAALLAVALLPVTSVVLPEAYEADLPDHDDTVTYLLYGTDGTLVSGSDDGTARFHDPVTHRIRRTVRVGDGINVGFALALSADGSTLAADVTALASNLDEFSPREIGIWDAATGQRRTVLVADTTLDSSGELALSSDGSVLASAEEDGVRLIDVASGRTVGTLPVPNASILLFHPRLPTLASTNDDGIALWDTTTGARLHSLTRAADSAFAFSGDGSTLATIEKDADGHELVRSWDVDTGRVRWRRTVDTSLVQVELNADGSTMVTADEGGRVWLWDAATGDRRSVWRVDADEISTVAISPDGTRFVTGSYTGRIRLWRADRWGR